MHHAHCGGVQVIQHEIAVADGIERVGADGCEAQFLADHLPVERIGGARQRTGAQGHHAGVAGALASALIFVPVRAHRPLRRLRRYFHGYAKPMTTTIARDIATTLAESGIRDFFMLTGGDQPLWIALHYCVGQDEFFVDVEQVGFCNAVSLGNINEHGPAPEERLDVAAHSAGTQLWRIVESELR